MAFVNMAEDRGGEGDPKKAREGMMQMFGPQAADNAVRQAIQMCWMMLPEDKRNMEAVEAEIKRLMDRALKDLKEDCRAFGIPLAK